jgi:hypothetical protein
MSLATWFRRWNSPEARQKRKKARHETWVEAGGEADAMRRASGPRRDRGRDVPSEDTGGPPQD